MDSEAAFCENCGSILPQVTGFSEKVTCYCCKETSEMQAGGKMEYRIQFNTRTENNDIVAKEEEGEEGPVVERICSKCGNDRMSYATLQLRSADEGQTVFFTCVKCKHKETENS